MWGTRFSEHDGLYVEGKKSKEINLAKHLGCITTCNSQITYLLNIFELFLMVFGLGGRKLAQIIKPLLAGITASI